MKEMLSFRNMPEGKLSSIERIAIQRKDILERIERLQIHIKTVSARLESLEEMLMERWDISLTEISIYIKETRRDYLFEKETHTNSINALQGVLRELDMEEAIAKEDTFFGDEEEYLEKVIMYRKSKISS